MNAEAEGFQQKKTLNKDFDAIDVINKTYADSTEYDLNDTLIFLTKAINKTRIKNKQLVKQHFGRFVQCRVVLEEIWMNIKQKGYDREFTSELEENIRVIEKKFMDSTSTVLEDSRSEGSRDRKEYYVKKYAGLFNIRASLRKNLNNLERFADTYKAGKRMYEEIKGSLYAQKVWGSIHDERCEFLETVYRKIQRPGNSFYEALYYFDLYFRVCEHKTEYKIMNTLLVNFKENATRSLEIQPLDMEEYLEETTRQYLKFIRKVDDKVQVEGTNHYFHCIEKVLDGGEAFFVKIWIGRLIDNTRMVELSETARNLYFSYLKKLKINMIDAEFEDRSTVTVETFGRAIYHLNHAFNLFVDAVSKEEEKYLREKVLDGVKKYYGTLELKRFSDLERVTKDAYELRYLLGSNNSETVKDLYKVINCYVEDYITKVVNTILSKAEREKSDTSILMEVVKVVEEMPTAYVRIVKRIKPLVHQYPVVLYYLSSILEIKAPELSNTQKLRVEEIEYQFGFLLSNPRLQ